MWARVLGQGCGLRPRLRLCRRLPRLYPRARTLGLLTRTGDGDVFTMTGAFRRARSSFAGSFPEHVSVPCLPSFPVHPVRGAKRIVSMCFCLKFLVPPAQSRMNLLRPALQPIANALSSLVRAPCSRPTLLASTHPATSGLFCRKWAPILPWVWTSGWFFAGVAWHRVC